MRAKAAKKKVAKPRRKPKPASRPRRALTPRPRGKLRARGERKPKKKRPAARRPPVDRDALVALETEVRSLRSARRRLEHRLTEAVQEIGTLRQFELRSQMFENELAKRDHEVARLREELAERLGGASIVSAPN